MNIPKMIAYGFLWSVGYIAVSSVVKQPMRKVETFIGGLGKGGQ
tara:strand:- start:5317 stop:5448 length:132 start_codon:yes stop_codon:yes gene_type:complete